MFASGNCYQIKRRSKDSCQGLKYLYFPEAQTMCRSLSLCPLLHLLKCLDVG